MCRLCLKESFFILFHPETASLNKRTEIYQGCKHKQFKFLADCKVTWNPWRTPLANYNYIFTFNLLMFHNQSWFCVSNCWWVDDETNLYNYSNIQVMRHLLLSLWHANYTFFLVSQYMYFHSGRIYSRMEGITPGWKKSLESWRGM